MQDVMKGATQLSSVLDMRDSSFCFLCVIIKNCIEVLEVVYETR